MRHLLARIEKIEQRLTPGPAEPTRSVLPEWLISDLRLQGIAVAADGRPDLRHGA